MGSNFLSMICLTIVHALSLLLLVDYYVGSREQDGDGGNDSKSSESNETEAINDHGSKLPVTDDLQFLVMNLHAIGDEFELFENALQLTIGRGTRTCMIVGGSGCRAGGSTRWVRGPGGNLL